MSLAKSLLEAATTLTAPFTPETLLLAAWEADKEGFGLCGYQHNYPDARKVQNLLYGAKGLLRRGFLVAASGLLTLTDAGRKVLGNGEPAADAGLPLPHDLSKRLVALLGSKAVEKYEERRQAELTLADALTFWGAAGLIGSAVANRLAVFAAELRELESAVSAEIELLGGRVVGPGAVRVLAHLHGYLQDKFSRHPGLLRAKEGGS